jgi:N-acyl-D-aspartate/D-glutamate deacylase
MVAIGKHHPRVFGNFPRVISEYVFKNPILSLENAIAKMTGQSAAIFGLNDRGKIAPGYKADLLIFNRDFKDNATFENPEQLATGLEYVFINGELKIRNGVYLATKPGKIL